MFVISLGFVRSYYDACLYYKVFNVEEILIILIYVDDMLLVSSCKEKIRKLKTQLNSEFEIKDLGCAQKILGMSITRERDKNMLKISQTLCIEKMVSKFSMSNCKPVKVPLCKPRRF